MSLLLLVVVVVLLLLVVVVLLLLPCRLHPCGRNSTLQRILRALSEQCRAAELGCVDKAKLSQFKLG